MPNFLAGTSFARELACRTIVDQSWTGLACLRVLPPCEPGLVDRRLTRTRRALKLRWAASGTGMRECI
eukprot:2754849-Prymnesium_polylepis.1